MDSGESQWTPTGDGDVVVGGAPKEKSGRGSGPGIGEDIVLAGMAHRPGFVE
jgi:hypothetical protein